MGSLVGDPAILRPGGAYAPRVLRSTGSGAFLQGIAGPRTVALLVLDW